MKSDRKCPPDLSVHLQICLTKNVHLQICAAVPNRHLFPFVSLPAYLVENTDTNTHTKLFQQLQIQIRTAFSLSLLLQNFPSKLSLVYLYLYVLAAKRCQDSLVLLFSLLPLANVWIGEENLNSSLKFIFPKHRQETINQLGGNRSPWIGRVFHETRSCLIKVMNYSKKILVQSNSSFLRIISQISVCVCGFGSNTKLTSKFRLKHKQPQILFPVPVFVILFAMPDINSNSTKIFHFWNDIYNIQDHGLMFCLPNKNNYLKHPRSQQAK